MILPLTYKYRFHLQSEFHNTLHNDGWEIKLSTSSEKSLENNYISVFKGNTTLLEVSYQQDLSIVNLRIIEYAGKKEHNIHFILENEPWALLDWLKEVKTHMVIGAIPQLIMDSTFKPIQILHGHSPSEDEESPMYVIGW